VIVLKLSCGAGHTFEGWFSSSDAFDVQVTQGRVNCPHCNDSDISRLPSGAHIRKPGSAASCTDDSLTVAGLIDHLRQLGEVSEDVGNRFPDEARRIHNNEVPARSIKGQASLSEAQELLEEGIPVFPIPKKVTH
jgi:hypothetical protein